MICDHDVQAPGQDEDQAKEQDRVGQDPDQDQDGQDPH